MNRSPGKKYFSNKLVSGDTVISIGPDNKGITGEVVEIIEQEGADKVILSTKGKNRIVIYDEMLEQYYFKTT